MSISLIQSIDHRSCHFSRFRFSAVRSSLLFLPQRAKYRRELEAAVGAVEKACRLCVDVKKSLGSSGGGILEKNDQTPVTVADFGVQALISLELKRMFPSVPLVAEEDSAFIRSNFLADNVLSVVNDKVEPEQKPLTQDDVLEAIDRGGKDAFTFGAKPATYWVLDPIDGTRGFLKGSEALYVVGLALVVDGKITVGVMGCPNWKEDYSDSPCTNEQETISGIPALGIVMAAHVGCGTWSRTLSNKLNSNAAFTDWTRCFVDGRFLVQEAHYCIPDSQTWDSLPLSASLSSTNDHASVGENQVLLLPTCCGSLCKYLMVASGRASVFILRARTKTVIKVWDHAVGIICVLEAGGQVTDWRGNPIDLAADQVERRVIFPSGGVLVSNGNLHNQILKMIPASSSII
ncbi:hypothetical protein Syun_027204 [Stephania yunnanensis]|uniref:PAP-specific phosphatase, mitochondrial n=1 Tax=Stephania yunnanensis TaxID=152371 RepID=A0AAP0HKV1_9MAGN